MLDPQKLKIDDRSIQQLLQELLQTYRQIPFYENGVQVGTWDELFKDQLIYFWVEIHETNLMWWQKERDIILKNWDSHGEGISALYLSKLLHALYRWFTKAESYLQIWIIKELESCVTSLNFNVLESILSKSSENHEVKGVLEGLQKRRKKQEIERAYPKHQHEVDQYEEVTNLLLNCLLQVQKELKSKNWEDLVSTERHPPHIGLTYGFLKAYDKVKAQLNELPKRHLDYYFKEILQQKSLGAKPDEVYLFFQLNKEIQSYVLPQSTVLLGEIDDNGKETEFETVGNSYLTNARITDLKTLLIHTSKEIAPLNKIEGVTGIYQATVDAGLATNYSPEKQGWHLFGYPTTEEVASFGWAWASPIFYTNGGQRSYELTFELTDESAADCRALIDDLASKEILSEEELFASFFDQTFNLNISGLSGWISIERYLINFLDFLRGNTNSIQINFNLAASDEAWVAYSKDIHGEMYVTNYPIIELKVKGDTIYYPYSFLKQMKWKTLGIKVDVKDSKELVLFNKHGLIDVSSPFPLFGVTPLQNDEFSVGSLEWVHKCIDKVDFQVGWLTLPKPNFSNYYQDYKTIKIEDKAIRISVNEDLDKKSYNLFALNEDQELQDKTSLEGISIFKKAKGKSTRLNDTLRPREEPLAFVNFKLVSPEVGFGSNHYNEELILYSQEKARDRKNKLNLLPPKAPFIPYVKSLVVNYQSKNTIVSKAIDGGNGANPFDLFHLHPHGVEKVADEKKITSHHLVPQMESRAYLYLGIEGLVIGAALSLYIKLEQPNIEVSGEVDFQLEYLTGKNWSKLNQDDVLENSVEYGLSSGVITFRIPIDINSRHPLYSKEKNWIRISVQNEYAAYVGKCLLIKPNGCLARRININHDEKIKLAPTETIIKFKERPKQVASVSQPMPSFGGKEQEDESDLYDRVSHHLSHKGRMVKPRDFKRMLFNEFDDLAWIKVATPSEYPESVNAGEVHIIAMPTFINLEDVKQLNLKSEQKEAIENFIKKHSYPGIQVKIFSPQIEFVEVCVDMILNRLLETPSLDEVSELIDRTISPWAFSQGDIENVDDSFNTIDVLNALNKLPSVWKVEVCEAVQIIKKGTDFTYFDSAEGSELLSPSTYRSILIPMVKHKLRFINKIEESKKDTTIGNMIIGSDLIVREEKNPVQKASETTETDKSLYLISTNEQGE